MTTRFVLPRIEDLKFMTIQFDSSCEYLGTDKCKSITLLIIFQILLCIVKIVHYIDLYKHQIAYYNKTAYQIMKDEIDLIVPTTPEGKKSKRSIITSLITGFIILAYEET